MCRLRDSDLNTFVGLDVALLEDVALLQIERETRKAVTTDDAPRGKVDVRARSRPTGSA